MDVSSKFDLKQLRYFVAVVDAGSISRASQMHHIAQPALSRRIAQLEQDLGVPLLHRGHAGAQPTEQGAILYRAAQRILRDMTAVMETVQAADSDPVGNVAAGCLQSLASLIGAQLAVRLIADRPKIRLSLATGQSLDIYRALASGLLDVALFVWNEEAPNLTMELCVQEEFFLVCAPDMAGLPRDEVLEPQQLAGIPFVFPTTRTYASGPLIIEQLHGTGIDLKVVAEVDGDAMKPLLRSALVCTISTWSHIQQDVEAGYVVLKRLRNTPMVRTLALCTATDRPLSLAARLVAQQMRDIMYGSIQSGEWRYAHVKV